MYYPFLQVPDDSWCFIGYESYGEHLASLPAKKIAVVKLRTFCEQLQTGMAYLHTIILLLGMMKRIKWGVTRSSISSPYAENVKGAEMV